MTLAAPMPAVISNRIAQIQARFEPRAASSSTASSALGLAALLGGSSLGGTSFDSLLGQLTGATGTSSAGTDSGAAVIDAATKYLGVPYVWGGTDPSTGLDCSGFVQRVYRDLGIELPRVSRDQARAGTEVASIADARPGDLIAFGEPVDHISIYAGDGRIIEAPRRGQVVKFTDLADKGPVTAIRRVIPDTGLSGAGSASASRYALSSRLAPSGAGSAVAASSAPGAAVTSLSQLDSRTTGLSGTLPANVPYRDLFIAAGEKYGLDPRLLAAIGKIESSFRPDAVSSAGATGVMQFMPGTARGMGIDPRDPAQSIDAAGRYLRGQLNRFGSVDLAVAAYNAGPGAVVRHGGVPPYAETQKYGPKILSTINGGRW